MSDRIESLVTDYDCGVISRRQLLAGLAAIASAFESKDYRG